MDTCFSLDSEVLQFRPWARYYKIVTFQVYKLMNRTQPNKMPGGGLRVHVGHTCKDGLGFRSEMCRIPRAGPGAD